MDNLTPNPQTGSQPTYSNELPAHVQRMILESWDLDKRGMALSAFIRMNPLFDQMDPEDRELMRLQLHHMQQYFGILNERIIRAGGPTPAQRGSSLPYGIGEGGTDGTGT